MVRVVATKDGQLAVHIATQKGNRVAEKDGSNASGGAPESQSRGPGLLVLLKTTLHTEPFAGGAVGRGSTAKSAYSIQLTI